MFECKAISLSRSGRQIIGPVDLKVEPGELLALIGPNGAGKSTLLALMAGLVKADSGSVLFRGAAFNRNPASSEFFARNRAFMPQFHTLSFDFTVEEVVALGRSPYHGRCRHGEHQKVIRRAMEMAEVSALADVNYTRLSGGQQARVQFARVIAQLDCGQAAEATAGKCLLLDEPTASLDIRHQHALMSSVKTLTANGLSCVAVLHDINLAARYADRIAILEAGRLLAIGTPDSVLAEPLLEKAFDVPVRVLRGVLPGQCLVACGPEDATGPCTTQQPAFGKPPAAQDTEAHRLGFG